MYKDKMNWSRGGVLPGCVLGHCFICIWGYGEGELQQRKFTKADEYCPEKPGFGCTAWNVACRFDNSEGAVKGDMAAGLRFFFFTVRG